MNWEDLSESARSWLESRGFGESDYAVLPPGMGVHFVEKDNGPIVIPVERTDQVDRDRLRKYFSAIADYRNTGGSADIIKSFHGLSIAGHEFETDLDILEYYMVQGEDDFECECEDDYECECEENFKMRL